MEPFYESISYEIFSKKQLFKNWILKILLKIWVTKVLGALTLKEVGHQIGCLGFEFLGVQWLE